VSPILSTRSSILQRYIYETPTRAPAINWLYSTVHNAEAFGYPKSKAEAVGYERELQVAVAGLKEMYRRGIRILPGGDYG
jgi:hypothetical protein